MERKYTCPVSREDLQFSVEMGLRKARRLWPKKHVPGDHDRLRPVAQAVVEHLELCGLRFFRRPPGPGHSTPDPWGAPRKSGDEDRAGGEGDRKAPARDKGSPSPGN